MKFDLFTKNPTLEKNGIVLGVFENGELSPTATLFNKLSQGYISNVLKARQFEGKHGQTLTLYNVKGLPKYTLLMGCGQKKQPKSGTEYRKLIAASIKELKSLPLQTVLHCLPELTVDKKDNAWKIKQAAEVSADAFYVFNSFKSQKERSPKLTTILFYLSEKNKLKSCMIALKQSEAINAGVELTKNLANLPSNICNPDYLAIQAKKLQKTTRKIKVKVLNRQAMQKLGMNALLAVAKGSLQNPQLVSFHYQGASKNKAPIVLVGKGITFDTGGLSLKPADAMVGMKYDMCGTATVFGVMKAAATLKLPINLIGVCAIAENMPSGTAVKPEDIVKTMSGQTVEIMNTDAEGRLVLCDALTYCERFKPDVVIDIATLTGAVVIALGYHASGLLSNDDQLAQDLLKAGIDSHDRVWQLPLWEEYQEQLKSPFADFSNVGGRAAGTITAACFLSRFAKKFTWAHLDVAGTAAMMGGNDRYATGRPVPLLMQYLINRCFNKT